MKLSRITDMISGLSPRDFYRYLAISLGIFLALFSGLIYIHYRRISIAQRRIRRIGQQREEARAILQEHQLVKQQQADVDAILAADKKFRILDYFNSLLQELNLTALSTQAPAITEQDLGNGYSEVQLTASFANMNMKQITELLFKIEQNQRVYTKELIIVKSMKSPTLDVTLVIATLQPTAPA